MSIQKRNFCLFPGLWNQILFLVVNIYCHTTYNKIKRNHLSKKGHILEYYFICILTLVVILAFDNDIFNLHLKFILFFLNRKKKKSSIIQCMLLKKASKIIFTWQIRLLPMEMRGYQRPHFSLNLLRNILKFARQLSTVYIWKKKLIAYFIKHL